MPILVCDFSSERVNPVIIRENLTGRWGLSWAAKIGFKEERKKKDQFT